MLALLHIGAAFALTVAFPLWLLLLGPLILGVPHVISDIRYLLLRPPGGADRALAVAIIVPLTAMTVVRLIGVFGGPVWTEGELICGLACVVSAILVSRARPTARVLALAATAALGAVGLSRPELTALVIGHLHNLIAFGLWIAWTWKSGSPGRWLGVIIAYALAVLVLASGVLEPAMWALGGLSSSAAGLDLDGMILTLAPGLDPSLGLRLVLIFAFAQAVHYAVWVRLVPTTEPFFERPSAPTFTRSTEVLRRDLGATGFALAVGAALLIPVLGLLDPIGTRAGYLSVVLFHGWLEIAMVAHLLVRRKR